MREPREPISYFEGNDLRRHSTLLRRRVVLRRHHRDLQHERGSASRGNRKKSLRESCDEIVHVPLRFNESTERLQVAPPAHSQQMDYLTDC
jgi:hypothetical protein